MAKTRLPSTDGDSELEVKPSESTKTTPAAVSTQSTEQAEPIAEAVAVAVQVPAMQFPRGAYVSRDVYLKAMPSEVAAKLKRVALALECEGRKLSNGTRVRCPSHALLYMLEQLSEA
jgi:hypothetical protein